MAGQKSFRRKYNKIRYQFKSLYETNLRLHDEEQKLMKASRRLQEQNDQILEILLDNNYSDRVPNRLRYALNTPAESDVPELQAHDIMSPGLVDKILTDARHNVETGELLQRDYEVLVKEINSTLERKRARIVSLAHLEKTISHTSLGLMKEDEIPDDIKDDEFSTYFDAVHQDVYLAQLDATIEAGHPIAEVPPTKPVLTEATLRNPVSTYNWLREHKPEVFVQEGGAATTDKDKDKTDEKETKGSSSTPAAIKRESRSIKRQSIVELLDDEGNLIGNYTEPAPSSKSKRKRDDDAYRPKGGGTSSKKRKKSTGKAADAD